MSKEYWEKLQDPRWQKKRLEVMERDRFTCRDCDATDKTLHVHHCLYERTGNPWDTPNEYLLTLCEGCHDHRGSLEKDGKRALQMIFSKIGCGPDDEQLETFVTQLVQLAQLHNPNPHLTTFDEAFELWEKANPVKHNGR